MDFSEYLASLFSPPYTYLILFAFGVFLLGGLLKLVCGTVRNVPKAAAACFSILFVYVLSLQLMNVSPALQKVFSALPFFEQAGQGTFNVVPMLENDLSTFLVEVSKMFFLAFFLNFFQLFFEKTPMAKASFFPRFLGWYLWQFLTLAVSLGLNYFLNGFIMERMSPKAAELVPLIFFGVICVFMLLMILKFFFKAATFFAAPFYSLLGRFFFLNFFGRALTGAFLSTCFLCGFGYAAFKLGWLEFLMSGAIFTPSFAPIFVVLLLLWYVVWALW